MTKSPGPANVPRSSMALRRVIGRRQQWGGRHLGPAVPPDDVVTQRGLLRVGPGRFRDRGQHLQQRLAAGDDIDSVDVKKTEQLFLCLA